MAWIRRSGGFSLFSVRVLIEMVPADTIIVRDFNTGKQIGTSSKKNTPKNKKKAQIKKETQVPF
jgi:hypothetical protein